MQPVPVRSVSRSARRTPERRSHPLLPPAIQLSLVRGSLLRRLARGSVRLLPLLLIGWLAEGSAWAQIQFGQIQGTIKNQRTGRPFPGVTVQVTGAALQGALFLDGFFPDSPNVDVRTFGQGEITDAGVLLATSP